MVVVPWMAAGALAGNWSRATRSPEKQHTAGFAVSTAPSTGFKQESFQKSVKSAVKLPFDSEWQEWLWRCALEEPASPDTQSMMPGWQPRRIQREPRLSGQ